jgi:hypothetical protein
MDLCVRADIVAELDGKPPFLLTPKPCRDPLRFNLIRKPKDDLVGLLGLSQK